VSCTNATFGDPVFGVVKSCSYERTGSSNNPSTPAGNRQRWSYNVFRPKYGDQCTAYALDRMHDATGLWMKVQGNAGQWADQARTAGWSGGKAPQVNSVVVMQYANGFRYSVRNDNGSTYSTHIGGVGHVAWVERVDGDWVYVHDQNWIPGKIGSRWIKWRDAPVDFIYSQ
jgi:surface antigen